jgi:hypothetical protein
MFFAFGFSIVRITYTFPDPDVRLHYNFEKIPMKNFKCSFPSVKKKFLGRYTSLFTDC